MGSIRGENMRGEEKTTSKTRGELPIGTEPAIPSGSLITIKAVDLESSFLCAEGSTNIIYEMKGATEEDLVNINSLIEMINTNEGQKEQLDLKSRAQYIRKNGIWLEFYCVENDIFENNLMLIDSKFPIIIAEILKNFFLNGEEDLEKQVENLTNTNPLGINEYTSKIFYRHKVKRFLSEIARGMFPLQWDGKKYVPGWYSITEETGNVVYFNNYNIADFEEYLLKNTCMEMAGTIRNNSGVVERTPDGKYIIKLNLQIRFKRHYRK